MFIISVSPQDTFQNSTVENDILIDQGMMMRMQLVELSQQKIIISSEKQYFKSEVPYICTSYKHAGMCGTKIKLKVWLQRTV